MALLLKARLGNERLAIWKAGRFGPRLAGCVLLSFLVTPIANAATVEQPVHAGQQSAQPDIGHDKIAGASGNPANLVQGFRSAHFGMTEQDVRKAIHKDFSVASEAIKAGENRAERTHILTVSVPDILPGGGRAVVAYVFGAKTKQLIQVGITWSKATDVAITPETLASDSDVLREYFLQAGYTPASIATNQPIKSGVLAFRGSDEKGHETALLLLGTIQANADKKQVLTPTALQLIYVENPKHPDIFRLQKAKF